MDTVALTLVLKGDDIKMTGVFTAAIRHLMYQIFCNSYKDFAKGQLNKCDSE